MLNKPNVILLLEASRATGRQLLNGIVEYSRLHGPWVFYSQPEKSNGYLPQLKGWKADGIIANVESASLAREIEMMGIPAITKVIKIPGVPSFCTDEVSIVNMAVDYFSNLGVRHFGYLGIKGQRWSEKRQQSYTECLSESGLVCNCYAMTSPSPKRPWHQEQNKIKNWLQSLPHPIGILAGNDLLGRYLIEACKMGDVSVPDTVAILGIDNDELFCNLCEPPLSSISMSFQEAGFEAAELLANLMAGQKMTDEEIVIRPVRVVERASTDVLMIHDKDLVKAVRFIRENASKLISVEDVVEASNVSRRVLEKRFKKTLNRSIFYEIRRARVEKIITFLVETDYPVRRIARELGFPGADHFSRYFKAQMDMSPQAYRQKHKLR